MRVLIADDSAMSRALLKSTLQRWGYDVIAVEDGDEAWSVLSSADPPVLAILDWVMPGIDGSRSLPARARDPPRTVHLYSSADFKEQQSRNRGRHGGRGGRLYRQAVSPT